MSWEKITLKKWSAEMVQDWFRDHDIAEVGVLFEGVTGEEMFDFSDSEFVETAMEVSISKGAAIKYCEMLRQCHNNAANDFDANQRLIQEIQEQDAKLLASFEALQIQHEKEKKQQRFILRDHKRIKEEYGKEEELQKDVNLAIKYHEAELALAPDLFTDTPAIQPIRPIDIHFIYNNHLSESKLSKLSNFGNSLTYKERLLLLLQPAPYNGTVTRRDELFLQLCWYGINITGFTLFGGLIRDFLIRGESPTDIDFRSDSADILSVAKEFANEIKSNYGVFIQLETKHEGMVIGTFQCEGEECRIDFVANATFKAGTSVDFDVNNFQITAERKVHQRVDIGMSNKHILNNIQRKNCRAIVYDQTRAQKMANKGWTILNS